LKGSSKKKRSRQEMEEVKFEEGQLNADRHAFLREHKKLKTEHELAQRELLDHKRNTEALQRLHAQGVIDDRGQPIASKKRPLDDKY
jgi:hypothetical protein